MEEHSHEVPEHLMHTCSIYILLVVVLQGEGHATVHHHEDTGKQGVVLEVYKLCCLFFYLMIFQRAKRGRDISPYY